MDLVTQEIKKVVEERDKLEPLHPEWPILNDKIRELMLTVDPDYVCVIKASELSKSFLDSDLSWTDIEHVLSLCQLCKHADVEYNYDYIQIVFEVHSGTSMYLYHPNDIPVRNTLSGNYIFKRVYLIDYHLQIELEEDNA